MQASARSGHAAERPGSEARFERAVKFEQARKPVQLRSGAATDARGEEPRASELDHALESLLAILGVLLVGLVSAALHALPPG